MKSYDFEGPCSEELRKDFDKSAYIQLSKELLNKINCWGEFRKNGDVCFLYEIVHGDGSPYENEIERTGHVLIREGKVIDFMSYNFRPGPIEKILDNSARLRAEHIAENIEYILRQENGKIA